MTRLPGPATYAIPYSAFINGRPISTEGTQEVLLDSQRSGNSFGSVSLRLGDIGTPVAGKYADILTLSFTTD
ncbi:MULTISPECIES: hypothetical protein [Henriciella]|uniref:hypothetical protein n=1 Tax=Henriciella TaxID=453849 RepID=UPI003513551E